MEQKMKLLTGDRQTHACDGIKLCSLAYYTEAYRASNHKCVLGQKTYKRKEENKFQNEIKVPILTAVNIAYINIDCSQTVLQNEKRGRNAE